MKTFRLLILALLCAFTMPARAQLTVGAPQTISETRVGRTVFEYVMSASVTNSGTSIAKGVTATCTSTSPRTTVVKGTLTIGNVAALGSAPSTDTFTIAHDRTVPFDPAVLQSTITKVPGAPGVTAPASPTNAASATVTGTAEPGVTVEITGGTSTVTGTVSGTGAYSVAVPLQQNRVNKLFITALNATGRSEPVPTDIIHDAIAPSLFIDFPADGAQLTNDTIIVAGRVGDMLSGFMGLSVNVNSQPANVAVGIGQNGSFERGGVALAMGANTITATATDVNGNAITKTITVTRIAITGPRMAVVSGDAQTAHVHEKLAAPIIVRITNADGSPFAGKVVTFNVTRSDGRLSATGLFGDPSGLMLQQTTDANGYTAAYWTLGGDAGCGNNRVSVTSKDIAGTIFFCASAMPSPPRQLNVGSGNNQRAEAGGLAAEPLRAWVSDSCNGVVNVPVTFTVTSGGGKVNGLGTVTVNTATTGHASVQFTLGPDAGANTVEANFTGNTGSPATFTVYGLVRDPAKPTTFTGLVLDNTSQPIGGAFCGLTVGGSFFTATTDLQGRFTLGSLAAPLPAGKADFYVNGISAISLGGVAIPPGSFPSLSFTPTIVPNAENGLTSPVLLPHLNPANARTYDGTTDLVLTCQGIAGLKMTIKAGSMRKVDGTLVSPANTTVVSLNQVHADSVPMPIPDGASPPFTWTLQPARATFDPPIQIEYPNMSGLPAGSIAYFLTYNHDTEKFEIFASGHVTNDGSTILSDPGAGLTVSGWGCNCPPYSVTGHCGNLWVSLLADSNNDGVINDADHKFKYDQFSMDKMGVHISQDLRFADSSWDPNYDAVPASQRNNVVDNLKAWVPIRVSICSTVNVAQSTLLFSLKGSGDSDIELYQVEPFTTQQQLLPLNVRIPIPTLFGSQRTATIYALGKKPSTEWGAAVVAVELHGVDNSGNPITDNPPVQDWLSATVTKCIIKPYIWRPYLYNENNDQKRRAFGMDFSTPRTAWHDALRGFVYTDPEPLPTHHGSSDWMGHAFIRLTYRGPTISGLTSGWQSGMQDTTAIERWSGQTSNDIAEGGYSAFASIFGQGLYGALESGTAWWYPEDGRQDTASDRQELVKHMYDGADDSLANGTKFVVSTEWRVHPRTLIGISQAIDAHNFHTYTLDMDSGTGCGSFVGSLLHNAGLTPQDASFGYHQLQSPVVTLTRWPSFLYFGYYWQFAGDRSTIRDICFGPSGGNGGLDSEYAAKLETAAGALPEAQGGSYASMIQAAWLRGWMAKSQAARQLNSNGFPSNESPLPIDLPSHSTLRGLRFCRVDRRHSRADFRLLLDLLHERPASHPRRRGQLPHPQCFRPRSKLGLHF